MGMRKRYWILCPVLGLMACAAPAIDDWPPAPVEASEDVIKQYVDRYALKEPTPRVYSDIELKALQILQERARYQEGDALARTIDTGTEKTETASPRERSRAQVNAIKRKVYRKYESAHDRRHELRSKYGL